MAAALHRLNSDIEIELLDEPASAWAEDFTTRELRCFKF